MAMRLKVFSAPTMAQAMARVRATLGDEAIIVATANLDGGGVEVTAARDLDLRADGEVEAPLFDPFATDPGESPESDRRTVEDIRLGLAAHGTPSTLIERLARPWTGPETAPAALAAAIGREFGHLPLGAPAERPLIFLGPPGAGKTTVVAKLAARLRRQGRPVRVITADVLRAGAIEQLGAYTRILGIALVTVRSACDLAAALAAPAETAGTVVLIDTPGGNPFAADDRRRSAELIAAAAAEPVLVLPAGGDPVEALDLGAAYTGLGIRRLVPTRLDLARRLGGLFAAAAAARTAFADGSVSPRIADDLVPLGAAALARLVLPADPPTESQSTDRSVHALDVPCDEVLS